MPAGDPVSSAPQSPCFVLLAAVLGQSELPVRGEGMQSEATNPLTTERRGSLKKLPGQGSSVLLGFPTLMGWGKAGLN